MTLEVTKHSLSLYLMLCVVCGGGGRVLCILCFRVVCPSFGYVCVACVVRVVQMINDTASLSWHVRAMHLIGWQNTWEQAPGRPRHPFPAQMAGEPLAVYLCTRPEKKKTFPSRHELQLRRLPQFSARLDPMPCRNNNGHVTLSKNCTCARSTLMVMSPYRYTSHFSLRHFSFNLNREQL